MIFRWHGPSCPPEHHAWALEAVAHAKSTTRQMLGIRIVNSLALGVGGWGIRIVNSLPRGEHSARSTGSCPSPSPETRVLDSRFDLLAERESVVYPRYGGGSVSWGGSGRAYPLSPIPVRTNCVRIQAKARQAGSLLSSFPSFLPAHLREAPPGPARSLLLPARWPHSHPTPPPPPSLLTLPQVATSSLEGPDLV